MGCSEASGASKDIRKIRQSYKELIESVEDEINDYKEQIKNLNIEKKKERLDEIYHEYNLKVIDIFQDKNNYKKEYKFVFDSQFLVDNRNKFHYDSKNLDNKDLISMLYPSVIIVLHNLEKQKNEEIKNIKIPEELYSKYNELNKKIEKCQNQIKIYEKEKEAAIIAKREEIRNNLLKKNMDNGVLALYDERQGINNAIDNKIINKIHNDFS